MKKLLLLIAVAIASTTLAYSLEPISVVVNYDNGENISVSVTNGSGPDLYTETIDDITPNSSGLLVFAVGDEEAAWDNLDEASITTSHVLNIMSGGTIIAQFRLDYLIDVSARSGLLGRNMKVRGNFSMNSEEFVTATELGAITSNIMVYTGSGENNEPNTFSEANLNENLEDNTLYYIVNDGGQTISFTDEDNWPSIHPGEFIILLKIEELYFILNHESFFINEEPN